MKINPKREVFILCLNVLAKYFAGELSEEETHRSLRVYLKSIEDKPATDQPEEGEFDLIEEIGPEFLRETFDNLLSVIPIEQGTDGAEKRWPPRAISDEELLSKFLLQNI